MNKTQLAAISALALLIAPAGAWAAPTNDNFDSDISLNNPDGSLPTSVDLQNHTTEGATDESDEPNFCRGPAGNRFDYGSTVWYGFRPHRNGRVSVTVTSGNFRAVANLQPYTPPRSFNFQRSSCEIASEVSGMATPTPVDVAAGEFWKVQVGGTDPQGSQGTFRLQFSFDPDSDGDGILDSADGCDAQGGPASNGGCPLPPPDTDGDGFIDSKDKCPRQDSRGRDRNRDGCLDILRLHSIADTKLNFKQTRNGIRVNRLVVTGVPRGALVRVACLKPKRRGKRRSCGKARLRVRGRSSSWAGLSTVRAFAARTVRLKRFNRKRLRAGTRLVIRIDARRATGKYVRYTVTRRGVGAKRIDRCTNAGSKKLRKKGCR